MNTLISGIIGLMLCAGAAIAQPITPLTPWYWQLDGTVKTAPTAKVYDIDMEGASETLVMQLHAAGHEVVCYIDAGGWEPTRSDASSFPPAVIGRKESGWPEYYLDIRAPIVRSLMAKRMDAAKAKGCDAIEPDVVDTYLNPTGFNITKADEIDYLKFWSGAVHQRGMLVALKNDAELVQTVVSYFDFSIAEECFKYKECVSYRPFVTAGKAVLSAEYSTFSDVKCARAKVLKFSLAFFNLALNGQKYQPCP